MPLELGFPMKYSELFSLIITHLIKTYDLVERFLKCEMSEHTRFPISHICKHRLDRCSFLVRTEGGDFIFFTI